MIGYSILRYTLSDAYGIIGNTCKVVRTGELVEIKNLMGYLPGKIAISLELSEGLKI